MKKHSTEAIPLILDFCRWLQEQKKTQSTIDTYQRELEKYHEWLQERDRDINHLTKARYSVLYRLFRTATEEFSYY